MKKILLLCEKPSQKAIFSEIIGSPKNLGRAIVGKYGEYEITIFALAGHIFGIPDLKEFDKKFEGAYKNHIDYLPFLPPEDNFYPRKPDPDKLSIYRDLKNLLFGCDIILDATDPDDEGKSISKEILLYTKTINKLGGFVRTDNLSKEALKKELEWALDNLHDKKRLSEYHLMANRALLKGDLNYGVGINASRYLIGKMDKKVSFGTAQTRLVDLIVKRTIEYLQHDKKTFFNIKLKTDLGEFVVKLPDEVKYDQNKVYEIAQKIDEKPIKIKKVEIKQKEEPPLKWYDGSDLAKDASKILKKDPFSLLDEKKGLLEQMYLNNILTYPRTDSKNMMPENNFAEQQKIASYYAKLYGVEIDPDLKKKGLWYPEEMAEKLKINHTPCTVARAGIDISKLSKDEKIVFDLAAKRLLSIFMPNPITKTITIKGEVEGVEVELKEISDISLGYKEIYGEEKRKSKIQNPQNLENSIIVPEETIIIKDYTKPPSLYTTRSILDVMKKKNIGAESTYKSLFNKVTDKERPFVEISKNKLFATKFAIEFIKLIPQEAVYIINQFEEEILQALTDKKITLQEAFIKRNEIIKKTFELIKNSIDKNAEELSKLAQDSRNIGKCPKCKGNVLAGKNAFICENRKIVKTENGWENQGSCDFYIPYKVDTEKISYKLTPSNFKKLLEGKSVKIDVFYKQKQKRVKTKVELENGKIKFIF
ncbi:DNA topoisomerase [Caminibacter pacificus]|uniref:DNA topoisomerase IA n=1 Tax=Caminibacter pacificus TaxID=1424653 RepID=A0AAJ4RAZ8_9BACT|nr:DNA topoisomerase [Caminibacter pacificus]QDD68221.1 type IA DNA topoisomerase [Caminibacter pacificus]ROR38735.1 DNA topoisomerase IA [Caminibacter pacificus]